MNTNFFESVIVAVVLYDCEIIQFRNSDEERLMVFERNVLRRIFGLVQDPHTQEPRTLKRRELDSLCNKPRIVRIKKRKKINLGCAHVKDGQ